MALLICTGSVTGQFFTVTRVEERDSFVWSGASIECNRFIGSDPAGPNGCQCENFLTFSTENNKCESYGGE